MVTDITGAPTDQEATGLYLVKRLLQNGSELSRACACGMLGELALLPEVAVDNISEASKQGHKANNSGSEERPADSREYNQKPLIRASLLNERTVDIMLEVLYEVTALLAKVGGIREAVNAAAAPAPNPRQSRRASMKALSTVRCLSFCTRKSVFGHC